MTVSCPPVLFSWLRRLAVPVGLGSLLVWPLTVNAKPTRVPHARPAASASSITQGEPFGATPPVLALADDIATRRSLDPAWVRDALTTAQHLTGIGRLLLPPAQPAAKNWAAYRQRMVDATRIQAGARFWRQHATWLARAEQAYGVPASIIVGILGVETLYGRDTGRFRVLDVLTTLTLDFPAAHPRAAARQAFFQGELEQFLGFVSRSGRDPHEPLGSFAGAMGLPQFMPSNWVRLAIDFDGDGRVDLVNSAPDAIGSIAHYLRHHGWQPGVPTHYPIEFDPQQWDLDALLAPDILPTFSPSSMAAKGVRLPPAALNHPGKLALIELLNAGRAARYVAGTENFYAITRYNWSSYYAMAVIELGSSVQDAIQEGAHSVAATPPGLAPAERP